MELEKIVESLVKNLTSEPDQVEITTEQRDNTLVFSARVAKQDMGRVIGKRGKTIEAIRTILGACGVKQNQRCIFQILDDEERD